MSSVQEVHAAIQALYGQNAAQQKQANEFLVRFAATPQAWEVSLQLVAVNDSAVCYFGANMLHGKCKSDWTTLPEAHRAQFVGAVSAQLQALSAKPEALLAARRLCLVMAAAAARSGPEHVSNLVQQALDLAGSGADAARVTLALEIQAAIAEEVNDADRTARGVLVNLCIPRLVEVLGTAEAVLDASSVDPALAALRAAALRAALAWLRLDERGGGGMVMSPGTLARSRAGLMRGALRALAADDSAVVDAATEFCCSTLAPGAAEGNPADEAAAIEGLVETLCAHRAAALAGEDAEHLARAVCRVAVAVSERDASTLTRRDARRAFLELTDVVLALVEAHERPVTEAAADYFLMINTVPVADRHPALGAPLFERLVAACVRRATLPSDFTTWDEAEEDRDTFSRFREQILADLLDNCYGMTRGQYLAQIGEHLTNANSWQAAEAAVFAARAVAAPLKRRVVPAAKRLGRFAGGDDGDDENDPAVAADRAASDAFLSQLFQRVGEAGAAAASGGQPGVFASHPLVMASTARMAGSYASWLGQTSSGRARAGGVAGYLLAAMRVPDAFGRAAVAFGNVCARCGSTFGDPETLRRLVAGAEAATPDAPPPRDLGAGGDLGEGDDSRAAIVEGLARIVAGLSDAAVAAEFGKRLAAPAAERARRIATETGANPDETRAGLIAAEIRLIASAVRFLEFPSIANTAYTAHASASAPEHPAVAVVSAAWPVLSAFAAEPWRGVGAVVDATCDVYIRALLCAKRAATPLLPHVLESLRDTFAAHHHPACFDALATAAEAMSVEGGGGAGASANPAGVPGIQDPAVAEAFASTFAAMANAAAACLRANPIAEKADVARAAFECAQRLALFAPATLFAASDALKTVLAIAVAALGTMERDAIRSAVALLSTMVAPGEKASASATWRAGRAAVDDFARTRGEELVGVALVAGGSTCPRQILRPLAQLLHAFRGAYQHPVDAWLTATVSSPTFPTAELAAGEGERATFCGLATRTPLTPPRWVAACVDFFLICQREIDADALVGYQM